MFVEFAYYNELTHMVVFCCAALLPFLAVIHYSREVPFFFLMTSRGRP